MNNIKLDKKLVQVKIFFLKDISDLEKEINNWIIENQNYEIVDFKISESSIARGTSRFDIDNFHTVLVKYYIKIEG